jgi:hypothetical protein
MAKVIKLYVPEESEAAREVPPESRGKVIQFSAPQKQSAGAPGGVRQWSRSSDPAGGSLAKANNPIRLSAVVAGNGAPSRGRHYPALAR